MKFEIGEVAEVLKSSTGSWNDCEIVTDEYEYHGKSGHDIMVSGDKSRDGDSKNGEYFARIDVLRKKKPPEEEINWMEKLNLTIKQKETA